MEMNIVYSKKKKAAAAMLHNKQKMLVEVMKRDRKPKAIRDLFDSVMDFFMDHTFCRETGRVGIKQSHRARMKTSHRLLTTQEAYSFLHIRNEHIFDREQYINEYGITDYRYWIKEGLYGEA